MDPECIAILTLAQQRFLGRVEVHRLFRLLEQRPGGEGAVPLLSPLCFRPPPGSVALFGSPDLPIPDLHWKKDGYDYQKRASGGVREYRQTFKATDPKDPDILVLYATEIPAEGKSPIQRRIFVRETTLLSKKGYFLIQYHLVGPRIQPKRLGKRASLPTTPGVWGGESQELDKALLGPVLSPVKASGVKIKCIAPVISSLTGGNPLLLVTSKSLSGLPKVTPQVTFGKTSVQGELLNPYTIRTTIPQSATEARLFPEVILGDQLIRNDHCPFEYADDAIEDLDNDITKALGELSSKDLSDAEHSPEQNRQEPSPDSCEELKEAEFWALANQPAEDPFERPVVIIQKNVRAFLDRKRFKRLRDAVLRLQKKFKRVKKRF